MSSTKLMIMAKEKLGCDIDLTFFKHDVGGVSPGVGWQVKRGSGVSRCPGSRRALEFAPVCSGILLQAA